MLKCLTVMNAEGSAVCRSVFGNYCGVLTGFENTFPEGVSVLHGDIDTGGWTLCYALAFCGKSKEVVIEPEAKIIYDGHTSSFDKITSKVGYLDQKVGLTFMERKCSISDLIERNIKKYHSNLSVSMVCDLFALDSQRSKKPLIQAGNEFIRARAAIEFASSKEIYCFPWLSNKQYFYYFRHIDTVCSVLKNAKKIILIPTSSNDHVNGWNDVEMSSFTHIRKKQ